DGAGAPGWHPGPADRRGARVGRHGGRGDGLLRARRLREEWVPDEREPDPTELLQAVGRQPVAGDGLEPLAVAVAQPDARRVRVDGLRDATEEVAQQGLEVERRGERPAHGEQRLRL